MALRFLLVRPPVRPREFLDGIDARKLVDTEHVAALLALEIGGVRRAQGLVDFSERSLRYCVQLRDVQVSTHVFSKLRKGRTRTSKTRPLSIVRSRNSGWGVDIGEEEQQSTVSSSPFAQRSYVFSHSQAANAATWQVSSRSRSFSDSGCIHTGGKRDVRCLR